AGAVTRGDDECSRCRRRNRGELADGLRSLLRRGEVGVVAGDVRVVLLAALRGGAVVERVDAAVMPCGFTDEGAVRGEPAHVLHPPPADLLVLPAARPPRGRGGDVHAGACGGHGDVVAVRQWGAGLVLVGACLAEGAVLGVREVDTVVGGRGGD